MDTINICRLCLVSKNKIIEFFSDEGIALNITTILDQHFWFQVHPGDNLPVGICSMCWKYVNDFHDFYKNIEIIHRNYTIYNIKSEIVDSNNDSLSLFHSNNNLVEPTDEIKIEHEKTLSGKTKHRRDHKNVFNKTTKLIKIKNKNVNLTKDYQQRKIIKDQEQQFTDENPMIVNNFINYGHVTRDELIYLSTDSVENNDYKENQEEVKKLDNPNRVDEDTKIREFFNLKCEICSSKHSTIMEIRKHYLDMHNSKNGYVLCCNKKLFKRCQLLEHMLWHTNPNEFKCKVCNKIYGDKYCLKNHMDFHAKPEERKYICDICSVGFTVRYHLMNHFRKTHLTQVTKKFKCNQCDKSFNKNSVLQSHIRGVHELKYVNICQICAKVYKSKSKCEMHYLEEHVNVNQPKLKCNLCDSMLKNETNLKCHMRRKHFDKPIACNLCDKIAPNKHALSSHMKYVHAERKHRCNLCDKGFTKRIRLHEHLATHSGNSYLYTCPYCTTSFNSDANMHSHRKKKHPIEWLEDRQKRLSITTATNNY